MNTNSTVAPYVLRELARAQKSGRVMDLLALSRAIEVRRDDVRRVVSALHAEGLVDAMRMRLTLRGFALGTALLAMELPPVRAKLRAAAAEKAPPASGTFAA